MNNGYIHNHIEQIQKDVSDIKTDIGYLHEIVFKLRRDLDSQSKLIRGMGDLNLQSMGTILDNLYARIIPLENHVFPGIQQSLDQAYQIIGSGENPEGQNPLDRRPSEKP